GSMQMLPSPLQMPAMERMYKAAQWATWGVPQNILDVARASHERLAGIVDGERMSYIAGCNQVTKVGVSDWNRLDHADAYTDSMDGDGTVPHALGFLRDGATRIPTWFVEASHGALPNRGDVITATDKILSTGKCDLPTSPPPKSRGLTSAKENAAAKRARELAEEEQLRAMSQRVRGRSRAVGDVKQTPLSADEMNAQEIVLRSFLADDSQTRALAATPPARAAVVRAVATAAKKIEPPEITIQLLRGGIQDVEKTDAISVGHYIGVAPQNAELAIDRAISAKLAEKTRGPKTNSDLLITSLCRRGVIVGELGQNFILPDPRAANRFIVIAGMGRPGNFREAELAVLTRELVWTLGRAGKKSLATVLIGSGAGNLETPDAVRAWLRGIRRALYDALAWKEPRLDRITFVEYSDANFVQLHYALQSASTTFEDDPESPLKITYRGPDSAALRRAKKAAEKEAARSGAAEMRKSFTAATGSDSDPTPVRLTIQLQGDTFQFAALTNDAAIPQRETRIDPDLVNEANDQLPGADSFAAELDRGNLLGRLLLPADMRDLLARENVPVVLALDATTARIHWEMVAFEAANGRVEFRPEKFLGTSLGVTRQLRTNFAQLPEPPMITGRALRVLVVADPAEDAPLPGAQEEGEAVAAIFEEFGRQPARPVEVVRLLGPGQATRVAVLDQLVNHRFDLLHFSGHCFYDDKIPSNSGWIFTGGKVLNADELSRIDRVPRFIFSNACESGITPDRASERSALLAPSFAEAFFARGVANFVCTAWPVDDAAALEFARRFYRGVLGLSARSQPAEALHEAMRAARCEIAKLGPGGMQTWGAYQHYGDPNLRFVPRGSEELPEAAPAKTKPPARPRAAKKKQPRQENAPQIVSKGPASAGSLTSALDTSPAPNGAVPKHIPPDLTNRATPKNSPAPHPPACILLFLRAWTLLS
ncbi:MAG: CHAT domain-containing protein, partial [Verrucomicrobiota bacterium]|nr:CHAT domain-containing protein [Verrucomicrobiota bacterium]